MSEIPPLPQEERERIALVSGRTHPDLAHGISEVMGVELAGIELRDQPDTDLYVRYEESVAEKHVIVVQSHAARDGKSIVDSFYEQALMIDTANTSGASRITAVVPNLAGARQDRPSRPHEPHTTFLNLDILRNAGATGLITVDPHSPVTLGGFRGPGVSQTPLTAQFLLREAISEKINGDPEQYVVVAPDEGHLKPAARHAHALGDLPSVSIEKTRSREDSSRIIRPTKVEGVDGRTCLILDDMIDTAGTLTSAAETLRNSGAVAIIAAATHGIFSDPGLERLQDSCIDAIIVTDTVPVDDAREALGARLEVVSVAPLIGYSLMRRIQGLSVSEIFAGENYS